MTATAWRLVKRKHLRSAFDGEGARATGGRWNSAGTPMVYLSQHLSLAVLEILVHLSDTQTLRHYMAVPVRFENKHLSTLDARRLPEGWRTSPASQRTKALGDQWVAHQRSAVLKVPSAVIPIEFNYLLNPQHPDFKSIEIEPASPLDLDPRL